MYRESHSEMRRRAVGVLVARREDLVRSSIVRENKNSSKAISDITYLLQVNAGIKELSILEKGFVFFSFLSVAIFHFPFVCWAYNGPSSVFVPTDADGN